MESKQPAIWAVIFVTLIPATICISWRLLARRLTRVELWWDDWAAIACYLMGVAWVAITIIWLNEGLGLHIHDVKDMTVERALYRSKQLLYIIELFYAFALFFGKVSILFFYWRMFRVTNIKLAIQILMGCSCAWIIIRTIMGIWHCEPISYFWDSSIEGGYCTIDDSKFFFGSVLAHVILDVIILSLPVVQIRKLRLPKLQKLGVMVMFMFGIFICIAGVVVIFVSTRFDPTSTDFTWNVSSIILWATVEVNLVTVSTCLPTIKPAFFYCFPCINPNNSSLRSGSNSYGFAKQSIRLATLRKDEDMDESSSTHQLADTTPEISSAGGFDRRTSDAHRGVRTFITGRGNRANGSGRSEVGDEEMGGGIVVKNETVVEVSHSRAAKLPPYSSRDSDSS
ncbi:Uu.00g116150.m01.CDS01 [Anthostomella pinea]|uniref:Uu.00g116150.m01.CDS01 n=1 Tax=Anthostomella pinea TaxID=933095 RepID=A0AAI8VGH2_9PEZI|nr:Uu.00g116150.m01.CDS01 [Anthostomella pinea]